MEWHGHRVHLGKDRSTEVEEPENGVNEVVLASMQNKKAIFEKMRIRGNNGEMHAVNTVESLAAQTVLLDVEVTDPDNTGNAKCIAVIADMFDEAPP